MSARARVWWHWMNGNVTREGITQDLEAMKRAGLGGFQLFDAKLEKIAAGPVQYHSPAWQQLVAHTAREAKRLGLEMTVHSSAGWSLTGGPWVKPAQAMRKIVFAQTQVQGPARHDQPLPRPPAVLGPFQELRISEDASRTELRDYADIAVLAFPTPPGADGQLAATGARFVANGAPVDAAAALDGDANTAVRLTPREGTKDGTIELVVELKAPIVARTIKLFTIEDPPTGTLLVSGDGRTFQPLSELPGRLPWSKPTSKTFAFQPRSLRAIKLVMKPTGKGTHVKLAELDVGTAPRINRWEDKAGFALARDSAALVTPESPALSQVIDLTARLRPNGTLDWQVPAGRWTVLRLGHATTGAMNGPAPTGGTGLECDKLDRTAVAAYLDGYLAPLKAALGPAWGKTARYLLIDSAETRQQTWSPVLPAEFKRRRGYDLAPFLPALAGYIVRSPSESDRFLWDFRRTIADLIADNHYGYARERLATEGVGVYAEAAGINLGLNVDALEVKGRVDIPMGEFWLTDDGSVPTVPTYDAKEAASAAHIYGKRIAAAEAFTARPAVPAFSVGPRAMKIIGDLHLAAGVNQLVLHQIAHQPDERRPGYTLGPFGTQFGRSVTWWDEARPWLEGVARAQYLLQQGRFVGDVLYFYGEGTPVDTAPRDKLDPPLPDGHDYDHVNADVLLNRVRGEAGRIVLPDGTSYRILVVPPGVRLMSPAVLRKLRELVKAGVPVMASRPLHAPGLVNQAAADAEVNTLVQELWASNGGVIPPGPLEPVLRARGVQPDLQIVAGSARLAYLHRQVGGTDLYFVAHQANEPAEVELAFRTQDRRPELWDPETGRRTPAPLWHVDGARTRVALRLQPAASLFVVFRDRSRGDGIVRLRAGDVELTPGQRPDTAEPVAELVPGGIVRATRAGTYAATTASGRALTATVGEVPPPVTLTPTWMVSFPPKLGAPARVALERLISWTEHADPGVRHFSGTATYDAEFTLPSKPAPDSTVTLDLGDVKELARVTLNGRELGLLWKPPYRLDATTALRAGKNRLRVSVTNLWPNRLIGDAGLPEGQRITWTTNNPYKADAPLLPSGVLGPVRLLTSRNAPLR